jgi:hypothetical protein
MNAEGTNVKVKDLALSAERWRQNTLRNEGDWIEGSIRAYLDGKQNLTWITRIIEASDIVAADTFRQLRGYGNQERYKALAEWFDSQLVRQ